MSGNYVGQDPAITTVTPPPVPIIFPPPVTLGTPVPSTSGTAIDFTGIPAGVKMIIVSLVNVGSNGTSNFLLQIGDAGGIENSGYFSTASQIGGANAVSNSVAGFILLVSQAATLNQSGRIVLNLENAATFSWVFSGMLVRTGDFFGTASAGAKSLSAVLDRIRLTTVNGTDVFDSGEVNIAYLM